MIGYQLVTCFLSPDFDDWEVWTLFELRHDARMKGREENELITNKNCVVPEYGYWQSNVIGNEQQTSGRGILREILFYIDRRLLDNPIYYKKSFKLVLGATTKRSVDLITLEEVKSLVNNIGQDMGALETFCFWVSLIVWYTEFLLKIFWGKEEIRADFMGNIFIELYTPVSYIYSFITRSVVFPSLGPPN